MPKHYKYEVQGHGAQNAAFVATGQVYTDFPLLFTAVMDRTFEDLTDGKAIFGRPGVAGCRGPYEVTTIKIELLFEPKR